MPVPKGSFPSSASGLTAVYLNNPTSVAFTQESLCIFEVGTVPCPSGWTQGSVLAAGRSNPGLYLPLQSTPFEAAKIHAKWYPNGGLSGYFEFIAIDAPFGETVVECYGDVPGFSCSVVDHLFAYLHQDDASSQLLGSSGPAGASPPADARFWSGTAAVRGGGVALVPVASYSTRSKGDVRERVVLRTKRGAVIGDGEGTVQFGHRTDIEVRLARGFAQTIAGGKRVEAEASVQQADGTAGTGETTTIVLTKLTPALAGLLHLQLH